jgi:sensor domain CHASE-containing protein
MNNATLSPDLLRRLSGDMTFLAWYYIIIGALICLSIIGALVGVPQIISGLRLKDSADELSRYAYEPNPQLLEQALNFQQKFFFIQKVLVIIGLVFFAIYFFILFAFIGASSSLFNV